MSDLTSPEHHGQLDLVAFLEKPLRVSDFEVVIVTLDSGTEFYFLNPDRVLLFSRFAGGPGGFVLVLPVVHHFDYWRPGFWGDFNQIHSSDSGPFSGVVDGNDADLLAIVLDQPDRADPDLVIYANSFLADLALPPMELIQKKARDVISGRN